MTAESPAFQRFWESLQSGPAVGEIDGQALSHLQGDERERAEGVLLARLSTTDHRIPNALSALGTPAAIAALTTTGVSHADDRVRAESLAVLLQAGALPDAEAYKPLMKLAQESADSEARITAVMATRLVGDRHLATPILVLALDDPELIVRLHAYEGLCHRYGLRATHIGDVMSAFALGLGSRFASRRSRAQRGLTSTFMGLKRGATPESLGVEESRETPALTRFVTSLNTMSGHDPYANDVDLQALRELKGGERLWAHAALEEALESQRDPRAPRALAYGSSIHSLDFLREIAPELDGPVAEEVRQAIQTLAQLA